MIWTVGHSTQPVDALVRLLGLHGIEVVVDVRSRPCSRHNPQFNREELAAALEEAGFRYVWMGGELGGRPSDPGLYLPDGHPDYDRITPTETFRAGLARLLDLAADARVAIMCAEADPAACHRRRLVTPALLAAGVEVTHMMRDGTAIGEDDLSRQVDGPPTLFDVAPGEVRHA